MIGWMTPRHTIKTARQQGSTSKCPDGNRAGIAAHSLPAMGRQGEAGVTCVGLHIHSTSFESGRSIR
jgi:hypothetical protein